MIFRRDIVYPKLTLLSNSYVWIKTAFNHFTVGNCFQKPCINWPKTIPQMRELHRKERYREREGKRGGETTL